jgi:hypothetical protein
MNPAIMLRKAVKVFLVDLPLRFAVYLTPKRNKKASNELVVAGLFMPRTR